MLFRILRWIRPLMSPAIEEGGIDPVPEWRRRVWAELSPGHRFLSKNLRGRYQTAKYTEDDGEAEQWWRGIRKREGTEWRPWVWLGWYLKGELIKIELFTHTHTDEDRRMAKREKTAKPEPTAEAPAPQIIADASTRLYVDRAGPPINTGLTEGSSNFATMTAEARRAAANPQE